MTTLLHGDNIPQSRLALGQILANAKQAGPLEVRRLEGTTLLTQDLTQSLQAKSLFSEKRIVLIENLFVGRPSKSRDALIRIIRQNEPETQIILWEGRLIPATELRKLPTKMRIRTFKLSPSIFRFMDSIAPGNTKRMLTLLEETKQQESAELIFFWLARRITQLISAKLGEAELVSSLQPWLRSRIREQSQRFSLDKLLGIHQTLYETDKKIKTGRNLLPLASLLDLMVIDI